MRLSYLFCNNTIIESTPNKLLNLTKEYFILPLMKSTIKDLEDQIHMKDFSWDELNKLDDKDKTFRYNRYLQIVLLRRYINTRKQ